MNTLASLEHVCLLAHIEATTLTAGRWPLSFNPYRHRERMIGMSGPSGGHLVTHGAPPFGDSHASPPTLRQQPLLRFPNKHFKHSSVKSVSGVILMSRSNSPPHPSMSLQKCITAVSKIYEEDQRNPIDREVAAQHIGYAGKSGASDKALAALAHYGLTEKVSKGQIRVSGLAVDIILPDPTDESSKDRALLEAGTNPELFKELRDQFPDQVSDGNLKSYLLRTGFNKAALGPAMNAYLETMQYLEQSKVFESGGNTDDLGPESDLQENNVGDDMQDSSVLERSAPQQQAAPVSQPVAAGESEWMRNPLGRGKAVRVLVTGEMGGKEIGKLIKLLEAQKAILDDDDEESFEDYL